MEKLSLLSENPKVKELKSYKGFRIFKYTTYSNCYHYVHYEAFMERHGEVKEYIDETYTLNEIKQKIDFYKISEGANKCYSK